MAGTSVNEDVVPTSADGKIGTLSTLFAGRDFVAALTTFKIGEGGALIGKSEGWRHDILVDRSVYIYIWC